MGPLVAILTLVLIYYVWLSLLATFAVRHDQTLNMLQKNAQTVIVWLLPLIGSSFVLHLTWQHYPDAIPKKWIPWPFKRIIFGKPIKRNMNRAGDQSHVKYGALSSTDFDTHSSGGGFDGGDGGGD